MNDIDAIEETPASSSSRFALAFKLVATFAVVMFGAWAMIIGTSILEEKRALVASMEINMNSVEEARLTRYCEEKSRTARKIGGTIICADEYGRLYDVFAAR